MLKEGMKAPDFSLPDQDGKMRRLSEFAGKKVVFYFYSKDMTAGCAKQAAGFAALCEQFAQKNAVVIGVSKDSSASHKKFAEKYDLPFILLSDTERQVIEAYDVWQQKMNYGKPTMGVVRTTYVIDENGVIVKAMGKVKAADNPAQTLELL